MEIAHKINPALQDGMPLATEMNETLRESQKDTLNSPTLSEHKGLTGAKLSKVSLNQTSEVQPMTGNMSKNPSQNSFYGQPSERGQSEYQSLSALKQQSEK